MNASSKIIGLALAGAAFVATDATAQTFLLPATPERGVWVESTHTEFKGFDADLPSTVWFFSGRTPIAAGFSAIVDVPVSHARVDLLGTGEESNTVIGNPYLGVSFSPLRQVAVELGTRVPLNTADEESFADMLGFVADQLRPEVFMDEVVPVSAAATFEHTLPAGFGVRARGGITGLFNTADDTVGEDEEETTDSEAAIDYGLVGLYTAGPARFALGAAGRWYATSDEGDFGETSLHHATLNADVQVGRVRPGVSLRVPLDRDYRDFVKSSIGLYLQMPI